MGLRFISQGHTVAMYDSVTDWAFGPVFSTEEAAQKFLEWAEGEGVKDGDVRQLTNTDLSDLWERYCEETENPRG